MTRYRTPLQPLARLCMTPALAVPLELTIDPVEKRIDPRLAVGQSMPTLALTGEFAFANLLLDRIKRADLFQRFVCALRFRRLRLKKGASGMNLIQETR